MMTHKIRGSVEPRIDVSQAPRSATGSAAEDETGRARRATDVASPPMVDASATQSARENFLGTVRTGPRRGWFPRSHVSQFVCIQASFDGRDYGPDYLILDEGAQVLRLEHPQADDLWAYGEQASGGIGEQRSQGWYPRSHVTPFVRMQAPFDGREYGRDYLILAEGAQVSPLEHPQADGCWAYGEVRGHEHRDDFGSHALF